MIIFVRESYRLGEALVETYDGASPLGLNLYLIGNEYQEKPFSPLFEQWLNQTITTDSTNDSSEGISPHQSKMDVNIR
jgi:hypothetical protein